MDKQEERDLVIIDVFPIDKGTTLSSLSFFTSEKTDIGDTVTVPIRGKSTHAIVTSIRHIKDAKSELKKASFSLKKASGLKPKKILSEDFILAVKDTAEYFGTTAGAVISLLVPKAILQTKPLKVEKNDLPSQDRFENFVIQTDEKERYANYRGLIREEFAKSCSVFFCVPTIADAKNAEANLSKGIEKYTFVLHGNLSKEEFEKNLKEAISCNHPVVIIGTAGNISIQRYDIRTIIVEKESSSAYKTIQRPFLDIRTAMIFIAKRMKARIVFGDDLLRIETIWKQKQGEYIESSPLKFRSLTTASYKIISPEKPKENEEKKEFSVFFGDALDVIKQARIASERTLVICTRKGLAPITVCDDCGTSVNCKSCGAPVTLHENPKGNFFLCHRCGERSEPEISCVQCGSWRLSTLGIGTDLIVKKLEQELPSAKIIKVDGTSVKTEKQKERKFQDFYSSPGSIMVGTEMALRNLREPIEHIVVASIDSLFAMPDFRVYERIIHMILNIKEKATKTITIQTRNSDKKILEYALSGNLLDFYKEDIEDRKKMFYPPFSVLVKITLTGEKKKIISQMQELQDSVGKETIDVFPAFVSKKNNKVSMHALLRFDSKRWPDKEILEKLRLLPPSAEIDVEPETIL